MVVRASKSCRARFGQSKVVLAVRNYAQYYAHPVHLPVLMNFYVSWPNPLTDSDLSQEVAKHDNPAKLLILRASLLRNQQVAGSIPAGGSRKINRLHPLQEIQPVQNLFSWLNRDVHQVIL
jgi:hypothetical protein